MSRKYFFPFDRQMSFVTSSKISRREEYSKKRTYRAHKEKTLSSKNSVALHVYLQITGKYAIILKKRTEHIEKRPSL
jgi:hypothetical protein